MGDIMRPIPFEELLTRIFDEYLPLARTRNLRKTSSPPG